MGYIDIIKRGFKVANKNLFVILTQILSGFALAAAFVVCLVVMLSVGIGSLAGMSLDNFSADEIKTLIQSSVAIVIVVIFLFMLFILIAMLIVSYVQAGNLGCMIDTASGKEAGFTASNFFASARRSTLSLFALYILWGLMFLGVMVAFGVVGGVGVVGLLIPLKDAGRQLIAFAAGVPFIVVLILAFIVTWFFLYAGYIFSALILVKDRAGAMHSIGESYDFLKRNFWDALLFSLLVIVLITAANMVSQVVTLPFNMLTESSPMLALALLPLVFVSVIYQMYVALVARCAFVVYYIDRTALPAPDDFVYSPPVTHDAEADELPEITPEVSDNTPGILDEPDDEVFLEPEILDEEEDKK